MHRCATTTSLCLFLVMFVTLGWLAFDARGASAAGQGTSDLHDATPGKTISGVNVAPPPVVTSAAAPPVMPGWPQTMGTTPPFQPVGVVLADVDNDGDLEVLAGSTDSLFRVWHHDGTMATGWPQNVGGQVQQKAAAADLDGDLDLEILIATKSQQLRIYHHDGTPFAGWPQATGLSFGFLAPSVYDLDDDGTPEVLIGAGGAIRAWRADGTAVSGFPVSVSGTITGTLAIGDIVGDASPEIVAVTTGSGGNVYAVHHDGTIATGWPVATGLSSSWAAPSIGDLTLDGKGEVAVVGYIFNVSSTINVFTGSGLILFQIGTASVQTYSCPVMGDADDNGVLEIYNAGKIGGGVPTFFSWDETGTPRSGWPVSVDANAEGSCIIVDVSGDGSNDVVIGDNMGPGFFYGFLYDGSTSVDFPFAKPGPSFPNAPEVGDVDLDGDIDMAMTMGNAQVALWDFPAGYDVDLIDWGGLFHDNWNTNQHGFQIPVPTTGLSVAASPAQVAALGPVAPNPFNPRAMIPFTLSAASHVRLSVHDAQGRLVRVLVDRRLTAGEHGREWNGRNELGAPVASGAYWVRLEAGETRGSRSMVLVK